MTSQLPVCRSRAPRRWLSRRATSACSLTRARPWRSCWKRLAKHSTAPSSVRHLLNALSKTEDRTPVAQLLDEPLSERELDVLRLLRTDLSGPEIARELMVSLSTMRTHTRNIYTKLGVTNRRAAVHRAEALALF